MLRACDFCGDEYEAKSPKSRFCSAKCRVANHHQPQRAVVQLPRREPVVSSAELVGTIERELADKGRLDSVLGQQAVALARRIESPAENGSAVASLSKELRAVLAEALRDAGPASAMDELRARRDRKRAG